MICLLIIILFIPVILQTSKNINEKKKIISKLSSSSAGTVRFGQSVTTKCVSMNIQPRIVRPVYNTVEDPFGRICVPNKTQDVDLEVFNLTQECMNFSDFLIVIARRNNFRIQFWDITNCEVINRKKC